MISKLKPVIVLSAICTLVCALLIVTYNLTYVDTSGIITDKLKASCTAVDGGSDYELITDRASVGLDKEDYLYSHSKSESWQEKASSCARLITGMSAF